MDVKGPNLVKGIHLEGLRVLGSPEEYSEFYYNNGADELFYQDVVASLYGRNSLDNIITKTANTAFIPLTVGGGIRSIQDITRILRAGADKVVINTAAVSNPQFIEKAVKIFGSSTIVIAIEAIKEKSGQYLVYTDNGREFTGINVYHWAKQVEALGAGEICLTSVDRDGTGSGFDMELTNTISNCVSIPVIAHGGASSPQNVVEVITHASADAVAIASGIHYDILRNKKHEKTADDIEGNTEFLKKGLVYGKIKPFSIYDIKQALISSNIMCRH